MPGLFRSLEMTASKGAEGLVRDAHKTLFESLTRLQCPNDGCAAPSGVPDAYYSFFAWLCLRALDPSAAEIAAVERYLLTCTPTSPIDALCARIVRLNAPAGKRFLSRLRVFFSLLLKPPRDAYTAFLYALTLDSVFASGIPKPLKRLIGKHLGGGHNGPQTTTPRLAAQLTLMPPGHRDAGARRAALLQRRLPTGGFVSSANAPSPDLLATAVARFALATHTPASLAADGTAADLAFVQTCWADDGLFGPTPYPTRGDAEHTFYALLALGTCRAREKF